MNQHLHLLTLGVRDFECSRKFYCFSNYYRSGL
jgi:hypothetical protein